MPIRKIDESEIRRIATKYVHSVRRNPGTVPNIQKIIQEALKSAAPERELDPQDVPNVISKLIKRSIINDKTINEAAKEVIDHGAMEDLKHMISRNAKQMGKQVTPQELDAIIKKGKLNPYSSSLAQIKNAVASYFETGRPLEYISPVELQGMIRSEMSKAGPVDDRDVKAVLSKYMEQADQDKPFDLNQVQKLIQSHMQGRIAGRTAVSNPIPTGEGPKPSQVSRPAGEKEEQKTGKPTSNEIKPGAWVPPKNLKNLTFFEQIRIKLRRYGIKSLSRGARNWLTDEVSSLKKPNRQKLIAEGETVAEALVGKMFMYFYDAKTKADLPYWDKFPLIFAIELYDDGWLGINLHYLDRNLRLKLFDKLLQFSNDKSLDKITKLRLSYGLLKNVARFPEVRPCIKRYLTSFVKSELLPIAPVDWEIALFLPVEQFQKERKETVWNESRDKIRRLKRKK